MTAAARRLDGNLTVFRLFSDHLRLELPRHGRSNTLPYQVRQGPAGARAVSLPQMRLQFCFHQSRNSLQDAPLAPRPTGLALCVRRPHCEEVGQADGGAAGGEEALSGWE